jgi:hypothetical protein
VSPLVAQHPHEGKPIAIRSIWKNQRRQIGTELYKA